MSTTTEHQGYGDLPFIPWHEFAPSDIPNAEHYCRHCGGHVGAHKMDRRMGAIAKPESRPFTVDQARTQDLERRGLHGAVVRSDGLNRAAIECRFEDVDRVLGEVRPFQTVSTRCSTCGERSAQVCSTCAKGAV